MFHYPIAPLIRAREQLRTGLRQILLYMFACTLLIAAYSGWLDESYLATHNLSNIIVTALILGIPTGLVSWIVLRILRFAFGR